MKNITDELRERIDHLEREKGAEVQRHDARMDMLGSALESAKTMLSLELKMFAASGQMDMISPAKNEKGGTELSVIIQRLLADGNRHHLSDIAKFAQEHGYPFGEKSAGRVVHFALIGMQQTLPITQLGAGFWKMNKEAKKAGG